ncbi:MAG: hypothetical protein V4474_00570 [Patescibacteria group bacterium]
MKYTSQTCAPLRQINRLHRRATRFDMVVKGAQALFVEDVWISRASIDRHLNFPVDTLAKWRHEGELKLCDNVIFQYQKLQRSLGLGPPGFNTKH